MNQYPDAIADYAEATASNFISNNLAVDYSNNRSYQLVC